MNTEMKEMQEMVASLIAAQAAKDSTIENLCKKVEDLTQYKTNIIRSQELSNESKEEFNDPDMVRIHLEARCDPRPLWTALLVSDPENPSRWLRKFFSFDNPDVAIHYNKQVVKTKKGDMEVVDYSFTGMVPKDSIIEQQTGIGRMYFIALANGDTQRISGRDAFSMARKFVDTRKEPVELADNRNQSEADAAHDSISDIPF